MLQVVVGGGPSSDGDAQATLGDRGKQRLLLRGGAGQGSGGGARLATSVCQLRHDPMEQGPTEPHAGRSTFLLSSGGAGGGYY